MWVMAPILGYALTEDYDLSKLLYYPIRPAQLLAGAIGGSILDFGVLLLAPILLVILVFFSHGPLGALLTLLLLGCFLLHTLALTQALTLSVAGILRARRSREIIMVISMVLGIGFYALTQLGSRHMFDANIDFRTILRGKVWTAFGYTPPEPHRPRVGGRAPR